MEATGAILWVINMPMKGNKSWHGAFGQQYDHIRLQKAGRDRTHTPITVPKGFLQDLLVDTVLNTAATK